jgi:hypothetical protein
LLNPIYTTMALFTWVHSENRTHMQFQTQAPKNLLLCFVSQWSRKYILSRCFILASIESVEGINNSLESLCLSMTEHALAGMNTNFRNILFTFSCENTRATTKCILRIRICPRGFEILFRNPCVLKSQCSENYTVVF